MDTRELFLAGYAMLRGRAVPSLLHDLTDDDLRARPHGSNSVAWLLWHIARCEDVGVNRLVLDLPQVLGEGGWPDRMRVPIRHYGTGMTSAEVSTLSRDIDLPALRGYWAAVGERTREMIPTATDARLSEVVDEETRHRIHVDEGVVGPNAGWVRDPSRGGQTRGHYLVHLGLTHSFAHVGEASAVRGLLGKPQR